MKNRTAFIIMFFMAFIVSLPVFSDVTDKIVAVVNDEIITQSEIDIAMVPVEERYRTLYKDRELDEKLSDARQKVLDQLIDDRLMLSAAKKANIQVFDDEIEAKIKDIKSKFKDEEEFNAAILSQNLNVSDLKKNFKNRIMIERYIEEQVKGKILILPTETTRYYDAHKDEFATEEQYKIENILIRPKKDEKDGAAYTRIQDILARIRNGESFEQLAKEFSEGPGAENGGMMENVQKGQLRPEIEDVISKLNPGEVSDIVQTSLGYHIFKMIEKTPKQTKELADISDLVRNQIYKQKAQVIFNEMLEKLRKDAYISIKK